MLHGYESMIVRVMRSAFHEVSNLPLLIQGAGRHA